MSKFIPREKLSKKARRVLDAQRRAAWGFSPVTRKVESKRFTIARNSPLSGAIPTGGLLMGAVFSAFSARRKRLRNPRAVGKRL